MNIINTAYFTLLRTFDEISTHILLQGLCSVSVLCILLNMRASIHTQADNSVLQTIMYTGNFYIARCILWLHRTCI